ncbi:hypothetical protein ScPMuIL_004501 [Solemya velum]
MYTLSKGPSKIVTNSRRGPSKQIESLETWDSKKRALCEPASMSSGFNSPRPVFNVKKNCMRPNNIPHEPPSPQHEEIVRYLTDSWNRVCEEMDMSVGNQKDAPFFYKEKTPNPQLAGFKPFDLEVHWGKRTLQKLTGSS